MASLGPEMAVNDVIEVQLWTASADQAAVNVLHYLVTALGPPGANDLGKITDSLTTGGVPAAYAALMSVSADWKGFGVRRYAPNPSIVFYDGTSTTPGTVAGDILPRQVAGFIRKKSAVAGKRKSGRLYVAFPSETDNSSGQIPVPGYFTRLQTLRTALASVASWAAGAGLASPVILHRGTGAPPVGYVTRGIVNWPVVGQWATQRRRGNFGRKNSSPV